LLVHNLTYTDVNDVLDEFNNICPDMEFALEMEKNNSINFLDITIERYVTNLDY
jgi:hypothetical protein